MSRGIIYRWRVFFGEGTPCRDVTASTEEAAKRTAVRAERLIGNKQRRLRAGSAERLFAVGSNAPAELFPPQLPPDQPT